MVWHVPEGKISILVGSSVHSLTDVTMFDLMMDFGSQPWMEEMLF